MSLHICEVTADNWLHVSRLSVSNYQEKFIESNLFSLAQSKFEPQWKSMGLYDEDVLVGYAMYGWDKKNKQVWLDRFMIDQKFQGKGYATRFLPLLIQLIKDNYDCKKLYLSVYPENEQAIQLYEKFGFRLNGEKDEDGFVHGLVMEAELTRRSKV
ncbi:GNAT family N-acetyltransferase [Paraliobacillus salinarum]|uniref:GNAT family N-acetyltransferase n=1 Tax=Paraliobacillus salinarum TaxID=1158996 RepID=UPI0015F3E310|nr:GNAT family N-acetyltransferase [Paraliobacillus salinarum]